MIHQYRCGIIMECIRRYVWAEDQHVRAAMTRLRPSAVTAGVACRGAGSVQRQTFRVPTQPSRQGCFAALSVFNLAIARVPVRLGLMWLS